MILKKFKTKRELLWYIQGLRDIKNHISKDILRFIKRYESSIPFMDFEEDKK